MTKGERNEHSMLTVDPATRATAEARGGKASSTEMKESLSLLAHAVLILAQFL